MRPSSMIWFAYFAFLVVYSFPFMVEESRRISPLLTSASVLAPAFIRGHILRLTI